MCIDCILGFEEVPMYMLCVADVCVDSFFPVLCMYVHGCKVTDNYGSCRCVVEEDGSIATLRGV